MSDSNEHQQALRGWIESATKDLTKSAAKRLQEEYEDHYAEAIEHALASGASEDIAHEEAMSSLGDSASAYIAAIPVHGDPHRLKVKAVLAMIGIMLVTASFFYRSSLVKEIRGYAVDDYSLSKAVEEGDLEKMADLLELGLVPNGMHLRSALSRDYEDGKVLDIMTLLLSNGADPNDLDEHGRSVAYYLVQPRETDIDYFENRAENRGTIFDLFAEYGADFEIRSPNFGWTLLEYASFQRDNVIIDRLRATGCFESVDSLVFQGRFDDLMTWVEEDPEILVAGNSRGATILHFLSAHGRIEEFDRALQLGASLNALDDFDRTVLDYAFWSYWGKSEHSSIEMIEHLLRLGCDPNHQNRAGSTPLHWATSWGALEVRALLDAGADPNIAQRDGTTPLSLAVNPNRSNQPLDETQIVLDLLDAGANVNASENASYAPLHYAVASHMHEVIRELVERGASLEAITKRGTSWGESNYFVIYSDGYGNRPLHVAALNWEDASSMQASTTIELLLDLGAEIDAKGELGRTALHIACRRENIAIVRTLLERGANPMIVDNRGETPLDTDSASLRRLFHEFGLETFNDEELAQL